MARKQHHSLVKINKGKKFVLAGLWLFFHFPF